MLHHMRSRGADARGLDATTETGSFLEIVCLAQNATFGNVVELILSLAALQKGLYDVVAMSLVGSVLSNLLLVLGAHPPAAK